MAVLGDEHRLRGVSICGVAVAVDAIGRDVGLVLGEALAAVVAQTIDVDTAWQV